MRQFLFSPFFFISHIFLITQKIFISKSAHPQFVVPVTGSGQQSTSLLTQLFYLRTCLAHKINIIIIKT